MTTLERSHVSGELEALGWRTLPLSADALGPLGLVVESPVAIAALVLGHTCFQERGAWRRCQGALADLLDQGELPREKDRYLVFIVHEISEADVAELETALADTHLARKLCIELGNESLHEALGGSVVLAGPRVVAEAESSLVGPVVPDAVLEMLRSRSPDRVLESLVDGALESEAG